MAASISEPPLFCSLSLEIMALRLAVGEEERDSWAPLTNAAAPGVTRYAVEPHGDNGAVPAVVIEVRRQYAADQELAIMNAVHAALVRAFEIPAEDRNVRLVVHEPERFLCGPELAHPEYRTIITIDCFAGRSLTAKRRLFRAIVEGLEPLGIPRDHVSTILHEIALENWGIGGNAASDVDLGFTVNV